MPKFENEFDIAKYKLMSLSMVQLLAVFFFKYKLYCLFHI